MDRKITTKTATSMTSAEIAKAGRAEKTELYHILGLANGVKEIVTDYGPATGLRGQFEATDARSGEIKQAPVYWPPGFLAEIINGELAAGAGQPGFTVRFAYTIGVEPDPDSSLGYKYFIDGLADPNMSDPFESLREVLPAPTAPKAVEDKTKGKGKK